MFTIQLDFFKIKTLKNVKLLKFDKLREIYGTYIFRLDYNISNQILK